MIMKLYVLIGVLGSNVKLGICLDLGMVGVEMLLLVILFEVIWCSR